MNSLKHIIVCIISAGVSGCGVTEGNYNTSREALRGSPALRSQFVSHCVDGISSKPLATKQAMAKLMNTSVGSTPSVYCRRLTNGISSGRISHAELNAGARGQLTPGIVRVLQGR